MKYKESSTAKRDRICAVVVTFNRKTLLEQCLTALLSQTRPLEEIIVIDNASTDGTEELITTKFPNMTYIKLPENVGGSGGFHYGIKLAYEKGHDWIWVMDDDAIPMVDALQKLADSPLMIRNDVYGLASSVVEQDGSILLIHRRLFDFKKVKEKPVDANKYGDEYFQVDTASFVGLLISRTGVKEVGLPLKDLFIYFDDTEYSLRLRQKGMIFTVPASKVVHPRMWAHPRKSMRMRQPLTWRAYYSIRNGIYTYRKHGRPGLFFYIKVGGGLVLGVVVTLLFGQCKAQSVRIILCGTVDGLRGKLGRNSDFLPD